MIERVGERKRAWYGEKIVTKTVRQIENSNTARWIVEFLFQRQFNAKTAKEEKEEEGKIYLTKPVVFLTPSCFFSKNIIAAIVAVVVVVACCPLPYYYNWIHQFGVVVVGVWQWFLSFGGAAVHVCRQEVNDLLTHIIIKR